MVKIRKKTLLVGLMFLVILSSSALIIDVIEDFRTRVLGYYYEKIGTVLFLHTDKSIYIPNESIWFKAYLLNSGVLQHEVLYLRLVNEQKQIVLQKQFPVCDIRSNGDMLIPDTMVPGRYRLIAYTDKMISFNPQNVFVQQIQVIKKQSFELKAEASFADSASFYAGKKPEIIIKVSADGQGLERARGTYKIFTSDKKTITEGRFKTGPDGAATLNFTYPVIDKNENLFLQFHITDKDQLKELNIRLPKTMTSVSANCYPEGGHLVNGISNRVLIVVTDANGQPMIAKVTLKDHAKQFATTTTNINGIGLMSFTPDIRHKYSLVINNAAHRETINFPIKIDPAGYVIQLTGSPIHPVIMIKNQNMPENIFLLGRTLSELKLNKKLSIKSGDSMLVNLPQNDSVNRVLDLGLFSTDNKLLAERLVYITGLEKYRITFRFDKASYTSREKVRAEILVTDVNGNNVTANLSVAVVAKQTLDPAVQKRITETDLNTLRQYRSNLSDMSDLNNALIREDLRTGSWAAVMNYQSKGQIKVFSNAAGVFGTVISKRNKKIDLETFYLYGKSGITIVPVGANGTFSIAAKDLITQRGQTNYLIVNKDFNDRYDLQIKDYSANFDTKFVMDFLPESLPVYDLIEHSEQLSSVLSGRVLREVVIKGKKSTLASSGNFNVTDFHSVNCSDYVCFYNILNCQNHKEGGMPPIEGAIYVWNGRSIKYHGCASNSKPKNNSYKVKNIDLPQTFYVPDYAKDPVSAPELQSTIFWEPNLNIKMNGKGTIEFYTSDIKGPFTIIVQGLIAKGVIPIFGKSSFTVISETKHKN